MNRINVKKVGFDEYNSACDAIRRGAILDNEFRAVTNQDVKNALVEEVEYGIGYLSFYLDENKYLNIYQVNGSISAELTNKKIDLKECQLISGEIELVFNDFSFNWTPNKELLAFIRQKVDKLWFSQYEILIYFQNQSILSCRVLEDITNHGYMLYFEETD